MSGQQSIADMAVSVLADIQRMDYGMGIQDPDRHAIREMKRAAEQAVTEGLRIARSIVFAAQTVREVVAEVSTKGNQP